MNRITKHHRGSVGPMHNIVQDMLVDILERMGRKVRKEWESPSPLGYDKVWVIDVADMTDGGHPVYYEVQSGMNESFREKLKAFAHQYGIDLVPIYLDEMERDLGKNPGVLDLRRWLEERII